MKTVFASLVSLITASSMLLLSSCIKSEDFPTSQEILKKNIDNVDKTKLAEDLKIIDDSLANWGVVPTIESNGVRYVIDVLGTGPKPTLDNYIKVKYVGKFLKDQTVFDQSEQFIYPLSGLMIGWQTTLPLIPAGSTVRLYIPSGYAYGAREIRDQSGNLVIPPNSNLIFEVELLEVL